MERMPCEAEIDRGLPAVVVQPPATAASGDWRNGLPTLRGPWISLRDFRPNDATALLPAMTTAEVSRFISPPPTTVASFERFIGWAHRERTAGRYVCFAVVERGSDSVIGLFQIRSLEPDFATAEWGFALAREFWGTGAFAEGAQLAVTFAFDAMGIRRLEARAALKNGRGNGALRKLGAVHEGVLRQSFLRNGEYLDQSLWTILSEEWMHGMAVWGPRVLH
jgi:ribosomal-protein-alanine N-acetyltransferase